MSKYSVTAAAVALIALAGASGASAAPDLSGYWGLTPDSRNIPAARLSPAVTPAILAAQARRDAHSIRWCTLMGLNTVMDSGFPINLQQGTRQLIIVTDANVAPRNLYMDRSEHIPADDYEPSTNGDSIAHWEGETLVVDTIGFSSKLGVGAIPGGGFRTESSHLVERYRLVDGGKKLSVVFTWTDPKVFRGSHSYELRYYRLPAFFEPTPPPNCDMYDVERAKFLDSPVNPGGAARR